MKKKWNFDGLREALRVTKGPAKWQSSVKSREVINTLMKTNSMFKHSGPL